MAGPFALSFAKVMTEGAMERNEAGGEITWEDISKTKLI